jgi:hypothetical protein
MILDLSREALCRQARRRSTRLLGSRNFQAVDEGMTTAGLTSRSP